MSFCDFYRINYIVSIFTRYCVFIEKLQNIYGKFITVYNFKVSDMNTLVDSYELWGFPVVRLGSTNASRNGV